MGVQNAKALRWEHNTGKCWREVSKGEQGRRWDQRGRQNQMMNEVIGNGQQFKDYSETDGTTRRFAAEKWLVLTQVLKGSL